MKYLGVGIASILERLLVLQVQGIAGELGATTGPSLDQKSILAASDLPDKVAGNVCSFGGHCEMSLSS
jgi:hypothetical protein